MALTVQSEYDKIEVVGHLQSGEVRSKMSSKKMVEMVVLTYHRYSLQAGR